MRLHIRTFIRLEAITDLELLSPNATPGTRKEFKDITDAFLQYVDHKQFHLFGAQEASRIERNVEWDQPEAPAGHWKKKKKNKSASTQMTAVEWYEQVMQMVEEGKDMYSAAELVENILHPVLTEFFLAEQAGFVCFFRGYSQVASDDAMSNLFNLSQHEEDFSHVTQRSIDVEDTEDQAARLLEQELIMDTIKLANSLLNFVHCMLSSIQAIKFSYKWNEVSERRGGKAWKMQYRLDAFKAFGIGIIY
ncbi:hypothetical protein M413DRAFT_21139 [Hebeloma cylindrosporum]|uniref:Uncharacterized protein n=1 Tax=Hebeloma cylindrosporum TaxID=76867 RepID=A0A0C3CXD7_HEBCY|nr:hypothetical protein M413DRAFT_21139 [Hebeloma cylindrosporum h7]